MEKTLKIAFLARFYGQVFRGAETYVQELSDRLAKNHEVIVLKGSDSDSLKKILEGGFDIVIATNGRMQALRASLGRFVGKYKLVISGQSGIGADDIWNIFFCAPDSFVALTDMEKKWAKSWAWKTKIVKIANGVDLDKFHPEGDRYALDLPHPRILTVGALEWYKHHEYTIKALAHIPECSLIIVGKGSKRQRLEDLCLRLLGPHRFKFLELEFKSLPAVYRACDLFVLPSWDREAFGIVYLEAMASGLGIVAPIDNLRREIIGEAGILTQVDDPKAYAKAIDLALHQNWTALARKQASQFSWDQVASQYEDLFKGLT